MKKILVLTLLTSLVFSAQAQKRYVANGFGWRAQYAPHDFTEFTDVLGSEQIRNLNRAQWQYGFFWKLHIDNTFTEVNFGFNWANNQNDSLEWRMSSNSTQVRFGWLPLNTPRIMLNPHLGVNLDHFNTIVSPREKKVPLDDYVNSPGQEMEFYQFRAYAGLQTAFRLSDKEGRERWLTLVGGYQLPIHGSPLVYSTGNRLTTNRQIRSSGLVLEARLLFLRRPGSEDK